MRGWMGNGCGMKACVDGEWIVDGWAEDRWMGGRMDIQMERQKDEERGRFVDRGVDGWIVGWTDG